MRSTPDSSAEEDEAGAGPVRGAPVAGAASAVPPRGDRGLHVAPQHQPAFAAAVQRRDIDAVLSGHPPDQR